MVADAAVEDPALASAGGAVVEATGGEAAAVAEAGDPEGAESTDAAAKVDGAAHVSVDAADVEAPACARRRRRPQGPPAA